MECFLQVELKEMLSIYKIGVKKASLVDGELTTDICKKKILTLKRNIISEEVSQFSEELRIQMLASTIRLIEKSDF